MMRDAMTDNEWKQALKRQPGKEYIEPETWLEHYVWLGAACFIAMAVLPPLWAWWTLVL